MIRLQITIPTRFHKTQTNEDNNKQMQSEIKITRETLIKLKTQKKLIVTENKID